MIKEIVNGPVATRYLDVGSGAPLVLLHGGEGDHRLFSSFIDELGPGSRVIAPDQRDCGGTRAPSTAYTLADLADDVADVIRGLDLGPVSLLGHSAGGRVAQLVVKRHPDLVTRVVLSCTWAADKGISEINPQAIVRRMELVAQGAAGAMDLAAMFTTPEFVATNPSALSVLSALRSTAPLERQVQRALVIGGAGESPDFMAWRAPTLVIAAARDGLLPLSEAQAMEAAIPQCRLVVLPDTGHAVPVQAPALLAQEVKAFLHG